MGNADAAEQLEAAKAECVRLEQELESVKGDLDERMLHADHLAAKYWARLRVAEREVVRLRALIPEPTLTVDDAEVESLARALYEEGTGEDNLMTSVFRDRWLRRARRMLEATRNPEFPVPEGGNQ